MLHLVDKVFFGEADDVLGPKTRDTIRQCGLPCECHRIWATAITQRLLHSRLRGRFWLSSALSVHWEWRRFLHHIRAGDVVWVCGAVAPQLETSCRFEHALHARGAKYVLHLIDNMLALPAMRESTLARARLADAVIVVTPELQAAVKQSLPDKAVVLLEEPVDVDRLYRPTLGEKVPVVIWTGRPRNADHITALAPVLEKAYRSRAFTLRIVSGSQRPSLALNIPWEWLPYLPEREGDYYRTAQVGIALFEDSPYNRCKGNYKVKTMLAAGIPVITSPVGYNQVLVKHGVTGFLANSPAEWQQYLEVLLADCTLSMVMGTAARQDMIRRYSHRVQMPLWCFALNKLFPKECALASAPGIGS